MKLRPPVSLSLSPSLSLSLRYEGDMELMKRTGDFFAGIHLLSNLKALNLRANALREWPKQLEM